MLCFQFDPALFSATAKSVQDDKTCEGYREQLNFVEQALEEFTFFSLAKLV